MWSNERACHHSYGYVQGSLEARLSPNEVGDEGCVVLDGWPATCPYRHLRTWYNPAGKCWCDSGEEPPAGVWANRSGGWRSLVTGPVQEWAPGVKLTQGLGQGQGQSQPESRSWAGPGGGLSPGVGRVLVVDWVQGPVFCLFSGREHAWGELRSAELSTSLQISVFLFLCELSSPWASSRNDRWSWANWEGVSRTLSKAELCNNDPYLDARTDRISPHTSLLPSHTLPHPQKDPLSRISTSKSSQSLDQSSMICRQVVESNYCLLWTSYTQRPLRRLHSRKLCK